MAKSKKKLKPVPVEARALSSGALYHPSSSQYAKTTETTVSVNVNVLAYQTWKA